MLFYQYIVKYTYSLYLYNNYVYLLKIYYIILFIYQYVVVILFYSLYGFNILYRFINYINWFLVAVIGFQRKYTSDWIIVYNIIIQSTLALC